MQYIYYFDFKTKMGLEDKTIVDNTVYTNIQDVLKKAIQIGQAFDLDGIMFAPKENERTMVYKSKTIDVYILPLKCAS